MTSRTTVHHSPRVRIAATGLLIAAGSTGVAGQTGAVSAPAGPRTPAPCRVDFGGPQTPFTEETAARGIGYTVGNVSTGFGFYAMGGPSFIDLDLDGDPDIVAAGSLDGRLAIYENDGTGHFIVRDNPGIFVPSGSGVVAADYDGDEDLDLFVTCYWHGDLFLRNDGGFQFTDVTLQAGVGGAIAMGGGSAFADVNADGLPDLFVANRSGSNIPGQGQSTVPNRLFINQGDGTFLDTYATFGADQGGEPTLVGVFVDFDLDGDPDLYEGTDKGSFCNQHRNELYENIGGAFVNITDASGTESCTDTMGIAIADLDGNGFPDLYNTHIAQAPGNTLLMNNGDGTFTESAAAYGVQSFALSWGTAFFDHDNDGDYALYVCNTEEPDRLYDDRGTLPLVDIGPEMGLHLDGRSYNVAKADIEGDGDLDLLIQIVPGPLKLYVNNEGQKRNSITLKIRGEAPDHHALHAHVRVRTGDDWQSSQVVAGGNSYRSQHSMDRHFGLGDACRADEIVVTWADGTTRTLTDYPANARYEIFPTGMLGDGDGDGAITTADLVALLNASGPVTPGTAVYDLDGNGAIDLNDLRGAIRRVAAPPRR